jgi:hypothetical protein
VKRRVVAMVWLLSLLASCALTGDRTSSPPGPTPGSRTNGSPAESPGPSSAPSVPVPSLTGTTDTQTPRISTQRAIRLAGKTQMWNGDTQAYETVAQFTRDARAGKFHATVGPVMARAVTVLYFHIRNGANYPSKQILTGTVSLELTGEEVSGEIALEGADFVGGARPLNRYLATIASR